MLGKQVSIIFCGGCNPRINRVEIAREVQKVLFAKGIQVTFNNLDAELVIYMSGCSSNCAQRYNQSDIPCIVVAASTVDAIAVEENHIATEIVIRVRNLI